MERRTFLSVVPVAKRSNLGPIFFLNIRFIYKLLRKKQKTGHITGKKPLKKMVFQPPPPPTFEDFCKRSGTVCRIQVEVPIKTPFLEGFCRFYVQFLTFSQTFVYEMPFLQKKSFHLTFSSHRSAIYKVPPRIG